MALRVWKVTAKDDWRGIFYIGWVTGPDGKHGLSMSLGRKTLAFTWRG